MDFDTNREIWDWQGGEDNLEDRENFGISSCILAGVTDDRENVSYMFDDETTPVKDCGDMTLDVNNKDVSSKDLELCTEPSMLVKKRRMLQFDSEIMDAPEVASACLRSKVRNTYFEEAICEMTGWESEYADGAASSAHEDFDESSEEWLTECFNDPDMQFGSEDMNTSGISGGQVEVMETTNNSPLECQTAVVKSIPIHSCQKVKLKGMKSHMQTPTKAASSIVYPFAFIKPCGVQGDVTLKDMNQKILTPLPSKSKLSNEHPVSYMRSAYSGKPVVGKTKIRTEGGKGSITIMRTKG